MDKESKREREREREGGTYEREREARMCLDAEWVIWVFETAALLFAAQVSTDLLTSNL